MESAIIAAKAAGDQNAWIDLRIRRADAKDDHTQAAGELKAVMADITDDSLYGKAAVLRLKHLYELQATAQSLDYKGVLSQAAVYRQEARCQSHLPEILYLGWAASCRREDTANDEANWRRDFLQHYPDNPHAAEIYFHSAVRSLAASDYAQALDDLHFIERRYPGSWLLPKVREVIQHLEKMQPRESGLTAATRSSWGSLP